MLYNLSLSKNIVNKIRERKISGNKVDYTLPFNKEKECLICKTTLNGRHIEKSYGKFCLSCGYALCNTPENIYDEYNSQQFFW